MATLEIDLAAPGSDKTVYVVSWHTINGRQFRHFDTAAEANAFALKKMGKTGMIIDNSTMTPDQRAAQDARDARFRAAMMVAI